ncbi:hypothetical protein PG985_013580 [Apiospora marii]|uniref:uncharacterized protein n=1 Tax=Apiospora marii TaxID=335849 RepID=UPI0031318D4F
MINHQYLGMSQSTVVHGRVASARAAPSQGSDSRRGRSLHKDLGATLSRRKATYRRRHTQSGPVPNPYLEDAATTSARIYRAPGPDVQYPRPMAVYTPSTHWSTLPQSDSGYSSRRSELPVARSLASARSSPKSGLLSCPAAFTQLAVGLFRAVGTALVCRSTSRSSLRASRGGTRPRRGSGASRHPQHRHMQTNQQRTGQPAQEPLQRPEQQPTQQPVQRPKTSRGPPSSLGLRGPDDDVTESNLRPNGHPGESSFVTARTRRGQAAATDGSSMSQLPTRASGAGMTHPPSSSARTRRRKHRRTNTNDESVSRGRSKRTKRSRSTRDQAPRRATAS